MNIKPVFTGIAICLGFFLANCYQSNKEAGKQELAVLNEVFLQIVDTFAYKYHTLRPAPDDTLFTDNDTLLVAIYPLLVSMKSWIRNLEIEKKGKGEEYTALLAKAMSDTSQISFSPMELTNTGRYRLFSSPKLWPGKKDLKNTIGGLMFSRVHIDFKHKTGIIIAVIRDNIKNYIARLYYLRLEGNRWKLSDESILEVS